MTRNALLKFGFTATLLFATTLSFACVQPTNDAVRGELTKDLSKYPGVTVAVDDCVVTLGGTVDRYMDKLSAEHKAHHYPALVSIVNKIGVAGVTVPDEQLTKKISRELAYDRSMQGNVFDWYTINVQNGVVTVAGYAHNPVAKDSALGIVDNEKGVKDVRAEIKVLPLSNFDDQIRMEAARRIYGGSSFIGSMDPEHPIRIIVDNGHVTLEGVVSTQLDKQVAGMKVNGLFGVFSVDNKLEVKRS